MPQPGRRRKARRTHARARQARETQGAQRRAEDRRNVSLARYRFRRIAGWSLVGFGVTMGVAHWLTHIQVWDFADQGVEDLIAGYPMAGALGIVGAVILSKA
jgi:hypothetical protein